MPEDPCSVEEKESESTHLFPSGIEFPSEAAQEARSTAATSLGPGQGARNTLNLDPGSPGPRRDEKSHHSDKRVHSISSGERLSQPGREGA
jgi:hypothetical protein